MNSLMRSKDVQGGGEVIFRDIQARSSWMVNQLKNGQLNFEQLRNENGVGFVPTGSIQTNSVNRSTSWACSSSMRFFSDRSFVDSVLNSSSFGFRYFGISVFIERTPSWLTNYSSTSVK